MTIFIIINIKSLLKEGKPTGRIVLPRKTPSSPRNLDTGTHSQNHKKYHHAQPLDYSKHRAPSLLCPHRASERCSPPIGNPAHIWNASIPGDSRSRRSFLEKLSLLRATYKLREWVKILASQWTSKTHWKKKLYIYIYRYLQIILKKVPWFSTHQISHMQIPIPLTRDLFRKDWKDRKGPPRLDDKWGFARFLQNSRCDSRGRLICWSIHCWKFIWFIAAMLAIVGPKVAWIKKRAWDVWWIHRNYWLFVQKLQCTSLAIWLPPYCFLTHSRVTTCNCRESLNMMAVSCDPDSVAKKWMWFSE